MNEDKIKDNSSGASAEERRALEEKLDADIETFMKNCKPRSNEFSSEEFEKDLKNHPAFLSELPADGGLPPLVEALQALKYDPNENTSDGLAINYKEDGNVNFKMKQYHLAIKAYSEGIKLNCPSAELNAQLLSNRAACHFHLRRYRKSLNDAVKALEFKADHSKAVARAVQCCLQLENYDDAITWCKQGLQITPADSVLKEYQTTAEKRKKVAQRNDRKAAVATKKTSAQNKLLLAAIKNKNIRLAGASNLDEENEDKVKRVLEPVDASALGSKVSLDGSGRLTWPVMLLYPEYGQTDFIQAFPENVRFADQLEAMFGQGVDRPPWDAADKYHPHNLEICFEDRPNDCLVFVKESRTLLEALAHETYEVDEGMPSFMVVAKDSDFQRAFRENFQSCKTF